MSTRVGTKQVAGRRVACTSSANASPAGKMDRFFPECRTKSSFLAVLRSELSLGESAGVKEITQLLKTRSWNGTQWIAD